MKVLLLNPVMQDGTRSLRVARCQGKLMVGLWPNIEHGYVGALLAGDGFEVDLLDANHMEMAYPQMLKEVQRAAPDILFILGITASLKDDLALARHLGGLLPQTRFVFWGTHATVRPEDYLESPRYFAIRREPDFTALELCRALRDGASTFEDVQGVSWHASGSPSHAPDRPFIKDLDILPFPDHKLMQTGTHRATNDRKPFALIKTSRGCPYECTFCTAPTFHGDRWRARSPDSILEEIQEIIRMTGVRNFFLQSDIFSQGRRWTMDLCTKLIEADVRIEWFCNSRVDTLNEDVLRLMKQAGCKLVALGIESGSDTVLVAAKKGAGSAQAAKTLQTLRKVGIPSLCYFVFGLPGETSDTIEETLQFIRENRPDYAHFYTPTALPGTQLYEDFDIAGKIRSGAIDPADFFQGVGTAFISPTVSEREVKKALLLSYLTFYSDPRRLVRELRLVQDFDSLRGRLTTAYNMFRNYAMSE